MRTTPPIGSRRRLVLGVDIGGSGVKAAPVDVAAGVPVAEPVRLATPRALRRKELAQALDELARHFRWRGPVGVGCPGVLLGSTLVRAVNLHPEVRGADLRLVLEAATRCRVSIVNDAVAATVAEMAFGAGRGVMGKTLVLVLGTGVGSAIAYRGVTVPCELGQLPLAQQAAEQMVAAATRTRGRLSWSRWAGRLDRFIAVLDRVLWPELIIIGGAVSENHLRFLPHLRSRVPVRPARLGNAAGIVGAALHAAADLEILP